MQVIQTELHKNKAQLGKLTIAIPTWNRADQLQLQLDAIVESFGSELEVIVLDNGSTDHTWLTLCDEVASNRLSLKCVRSSINCGCDVNYLRALETATGEWTWLIGDDDPISYNCFQRDILTLLDRAKADLILLTNFDDLAHLKGDVFQLSIDQFFDASIDFSAGWLLKLSRSVCRTQPALEWIPYAYRHGVGSLHSYSYVHGKLFQKCGIDVIYSDFLFLQDPYQNHRWDLLDGHLGAWKTNLAIFSTSKKYVRAREKRLRAHHLFEAAVNKLNRGESSRPWIIFLIRELPLKYKIKLFYHYCISKMQSVPSILIKRDAYLERKIEY